MLLNLYPDDPDRPSMEELLRPTRIYTEVLDMCQQHNILGVAHITGGGFKENIARVLPAGYTIKLNDWDLPPVFQWIQQRSGLFAPDQMRGIFNCGYGMVLIAPPGLDQKLDLDVIGAVCRITKSDTHTVHTPYTVHTDHTNHAGHVDHVDHAYTQCQRADHPNQRDP